MREPMAPSRTLPAAAIALGATLLLAGCVSTPTGPSILVLPGSTKTFEQFRVDDFECRQYASMQVNGSTPDQAAMDSGVKSAVVGTAVGAAAGALIGGHQGAGSGAGAGLVVGALAGSGAAQYEVTVRFNSSVTQDDIDEAAALLRTFDDDVEFLIMEMFPPVGRAVAAGTSGFCQAVAAELGARSYVNDVSCRPLAGGGGAEPEAPVSTNVP